ncbi:hypothetical protein BTH42_19685, partial [Burkholderia sp. SRS-W-2-2016]
MKTRKFNQYYCGVRRDAVIVAVLTALASQLGYAASTDVIPQWREIAAASAPAPAGSAPLLLAQNDGAATGTQANTPTAADDAAAVFAPAGCGSLGLGGCGPHGGSGNGAAGGSANGGAAASRNSGTGG